LSKVSTPELIEVPEQDWQEARRRLAIIQPLSAAKARTRDSVTLAAKHLRLSVTHAYRRGAVSTQAVEIMHHVHLIVIAKSMGGPQT